jgi:hypothetical protein
VHERMGGPVIVLAFQPRPAPRAVPKRPSGRGSGANVRGQAGRAERVQHDTRRRPRPPAPRLLGRAVLSQ